MFSSGKNKCPQCGTRFVDSVGMEAKGEKVMIRVKREKGKVEKEEKGEKGSFVFMRRVS